MSRAAAPEDRLFGELSRRLGERSPERLPPDEAEARAAVALLLAGPGRGGELRGLPGMEERDSLPPPWGSVHALLILRTRVEGDPWAGHVALPGGKREAGDADLVDTALRETAEETGLLVDRADVVGRLSDLHPRSAHLPDLAIRPYVARWRGRGDLAFNPEVEDAFWIPLGELADPRRRSRHVVERSGGSRRFPAIDIGEHTVWGLTHAIIREFLSALAGGSGRAG